MDSAIHLSYKRPLMNKYAVRYGLHWVIVKFILKLTSQTSKSIKKSLWFVIAASKREKSFKCCSSFQTLSLLKLNKNLKNQDKRNACVIFINFLITSVIFYKRTCPVFSHFLTIMSNNNELRKN